MGKFKEGLADGHGTYYFENGEKAMGIWEEGKVSDYYLNK